MTTAAAIEPPFARVGLAGLGLIGGSIARAIRARWPRVEIAACDHDDVLGRASADRLIDRAVAHVGDLADADLVVLALPLPSMAVAMRTLAAAGVRGVVTDVGSTKRDLLRDASAAGLARFVGGHPMAGSERTGLAHADADLFVGRPWLVVPGDAAEADAAAVERFAAGLGARPVRLDADAHDRAVAYISHLPQVIAVALTNAATAALGDAHEPVAGRAFGEMTRLAASPPPMWREIFSRNADFIAEALDQFLAALPAGAAPLESRGWVDDAFARAASARARLLAAQARPPE